MKLLIASSNPGKLRDFAAAASPYQVEVQLIPDFYRLPEPVEDGATFAENAKKKSEHYSRYVPGELVVADDSGLEVDALQGAPGVYSARYAAITSQRNPCPYAAPGPENQARNQPANSRDADNNNCLLRELAEVQDRLRGGQFVCVLSVAQDGRELASFRGEARGVLLRSPRGRGGFGYDPLFLFPRLAKTFAELSLEEKAAVSHRGQALRKLLAWSEERG